MQRIQPPSRGCVLKHRINLHAVSSGCSAAFARLCVETIPMKRLFKFEAVSRLRAAVC